MRDQIAEETAGIPSRGDATSEAGVTRIDLVCGARAGVEAVESVRRWAADRALSVAVTDRLSRTVLAAMALGRRFAPGGLTIRLRWGDVDHVRLDLRWHRCRKHPTTEDPESRAAAATLDAVADEWGPSAVDAMSHWAVVDAR